MSATWRLFDLVAPRDTSFESIVLTEQQRQENASVVRNVYKTDNDIARRQVNRAQLVLDYIEHVRNDPFASRAQKEADLAAMEDLALENDVVSRLLSFNDAEWRQVRDQAIAVLGSVMSGEVREDNLEAIRQTVPRRSVFLPVEQEAVVTNLVNLLTKPNTFIDPEATQSAREIAKASVPPVVRSFQQGQVVVSGGQVINEADMEALIQLGLLHAGDTNAPELAAAFIAVLVSLVMVGLYLNRYHLRNSEEVRVILLSGLFFLAFLALARLMVDQPGSNMVAYLYPAVALSLLLTALVGARFAIMASIVLALLVGIISASVEMVTLTAIGSVVAALTLRRDAHINAFFIADVQAGVANAGVILAFGVTEFSIDGSLLLQTGLGLANGVLSAALALAGLFILGSVFNITTGLMLAELARADHPLQQSLIRKAPGTYQHSLLIANMAENAAEAIGADELLVRVGSMYHDIGKMYDPIIFVENQHYGGDNIHDRLEPVQSAQYIIRHVPEGDRMARKHRLPAAVRDFIWEHHGTTTVRYFLHKAIEQAGGDESAVNVADFTYPGPRPQSRETAVLMLADSCEARCAPTARPTRKASAPSSTPSCSKRPAPASSTTAA
ncbi:MAG: HDIG domain-containing protein [Anaerolineae bacterium]|nr:HDIG domain-containing protein [Anaerolineae bacterium]